MNTCSRQSRASRREFLQGLAGAIGCGSAAAIIPQFGLVGSALAAAKGNVTGYKALVCIYLDGGNDAFNMLVPYDQARYDAYSVARGGVNSVANPAGLALDRTLLGPTQIVDSATGAQYALHPGIPGGAATNDDRGMLDLHGLYQQAAQPGGCQIAFIPNIGTLTRPITKTEYNANPGLRPPQLYSHQDQTYQWQFGRAGNSAVGWGGTVGDQLRAQNFNQTLSPCISIAGDNRFQIGLQTFPYQLGTGGLTALQTGGGTQRANAIAQILAGSQPSPFATEYQAVMNRAQGVYNVLNPALNDPNGLGMVTTPFPLQNSLGDQLRMVARMIKVSRDTGFGIQHQRQIYFVRLGGFDMHDSLMAQGANGHANLLQRVSEAMLAFWNALGEIGARNEVTTFTMSEFARTLSSNGNGSDHAWGSVAMVMGGTQVLGGRLYGAYPDLVLNGAISLDRGQQIPQIGVEQYAATLARWMGVTDNTTLGTIFPNLGQFASSDLGFMAP